MTFFPQRILLFLFNLSAFVVNLAFFQADFVDSATKWAGFLTFLLVAATAIISALYSIFRGIKVKDLEAKNAGLRTDVADLTVKVATKEADKVLLNAEIVRLRLKLKNERKVTLSQAAKLEGVNLPEDHYEDGCDV